MSKEGKFTFAPTSFVFKAPESGSAAIFSAPASTPATESSQQVQEEECKVEFAPVTRLTEQVEVKHVEDEEEQLFKVRSKLYRFDKPTGLWKERGTGDVQLMKHKENGKVRVLMRRDKTLKICANHYLTKEIKLEPNVGSDRAWMWTSLSDFADGEPKAEILCIKFTNSENANNFKDRFETAQQEMFKEEEEEEKKE